MLANGTFLADLGNWINSDSNCNQKNTNTASEITTIGPYSKIGENSRETTSTDSTVAHSSTTEVSTVKETPTTPTTTPAPPERANFTWVYKKTEPKEKFNEKIKEQGFRIIGNVLENWEQINFQMLKSDKKELLLNLTISLNKSDGKIVVEYLEGTRIEMKKLQLENFNITDGKRIEFIFRDGTLKVNGIDVHTVEKPENNMLTIKIVGDIDQKSISNHPIFKLPMLYRLRDHPDDGNFKDSTAVLSVSGRMNDNKHVREQNFFLDLVYRYYEDEGGYSNALNCYEELEGYCDVLFNFYTDFTDNFTQFNTLRVYKKEKKDRSSLGFEKKWQQRERSSGTIFKLDEEFLFQVKIRNKTNYSIYLNGHEVKKRSLVLEKREPERLNSPEFIRIHASSDNYDQLTLYGLPILTKEESG